MSFVQGVSSAYGTNSAFTQTFGSYNTVGNMLICQLDIAGTGTASIASSNTGWQQLYQSASILTGHVDAAWYLPNCLGGISDSITVTMTVSGFGQICIGEYSGITTLDQVGALSGNTSGSITTNSVTTAHATETMIAFFVASNQIASISPPFSVLRESITYVRNPYTGFCDYSVTSTGTYSATMNAGTAGGNVSYLASFYTPSGAVSGTNQLMMQGVGT